MARDSRNRKSPHEEGEEGISYVAASRGAGLSILAILPLVVLYQVGIVDAGSQVRNIAEVWVTSPLGLLDMPAATVLNMVLLVALLYALAQSSRAGPVSFAFLGLMVVEGFLYALLMYTGMAAATSYVLSKVGPMLAVGGVPAQAFLLSIGAGVYEELLFRLLLVGGGTLVLEGLFQWGRFTSLFVTVILSSFLFAAAHHVGTLAEPVTSFAFLFRALSGVALATVYVARGLGVAVWTHALYNVLVLFSQP